MTILALMTGLRASPKSDVKARYLRVETMRGEGWVVKRLEEWMKKDKLSLNIQRERRKRAIYFDKIV